jgi:hypothetical protein
MYNTNEIITSNTLKRETVLILLSINSVSIEAFQVLHRHLHLQFLLIDHSKT